MKSYNVRYSTAVMIAIIIITNGCDSNILPLKGNYTDSPVEFTSTISSDSLWMVITHIFSEKGLTVKKIDKNKGFIVSKKTPFNSVYTFEDKEGKLEKPQAWVVLMKDSTNNKLWYPKRIYGKWGIQINETETGSTIKMDPIVICTFYPNMFTAVETRGQSTGNLEKLIDSSLLNNLNRVTTH